MITVVTIVMQVFKRILLHPVAHRTSQITGDSVRYLLRWLQAYYYLVTVSLISVCTTYSPRELGELAQKEIG